MTAPHPDPQTLWDQACALLDQDPPQALQLAETLLSHYQDAPHLRLLAGSAALRSQDHQRAVTHFQRATQLSPQDPQAWNALGAALIEADRPNEASPPLQQALRLAPHHPQALFNLAAAQLKQGHKEEAWQHYKTLLQQHPQHLGALEQLIRLGIELQRPTEAIDAFQTLQHQAPERLEPLALPFLQTLIEHGETETLPTLLASLDYDTQLHIANLLLDQGHLDQAESIYHRLTQSHPQRPEAFNNLAITLGRQGQEQHAIDLLHHALTQHPEYADLLSTLAALQLDIDQLEAAEQNARRTLALDSDRPAALATLAAAIQRQGRLPEAKTLLEKALQDHPSFPLLWYNLGTTQADQGRHHEAMESFQRALELDPDHRDSRANLGILQLGLGEFRAGWGNYFHRHRHIDPPEPLTPITPGRDHHGLHILLTRSQGIGDELFFLRFLPALKAQGTTLSYRSDPKLAPLIRRSGLFKTVLDSNEPPPIHPDAVYAVDDLPLLLDAGPGDHPPPLPLAPLPSRKTTWTQKLAELGPPPYLGLTWRAGSQNANHGIHRFLDKAIALDTLAQTIRDWPGTLISLQRNPQPGETQHLSQLCGQTIHDLSHINDDLDDALALLDLIDHYVAVSNTNIHLRAGLGKTAHVLIPHPPEWRWMAHGDTSPWFPGFRLYRQRPDGDWGPAITALRNALHEPGHS